MARRHSIEGRPQGGKGGIILVIIVIAVIAVVAYLMLSPKGPTVSESKNLLAQAQLALANIDKESFTYDGYIEVNSESGTHANVPFSGDGRIDTKNERMYLKINLESSQAGGGSIVFETYTIGKTVYMNFAGTWAKVTGYDKLWTGSEFSKKLVDFSMDFDSKVVSRETVNGKQTIKIVINPTIEQIASLISDMDPSVMSSLGLTDVDSVGAGVKKIELGVWIDSNGFLPVKAQLDIESSSKTLNPAGSGVVSNDVIISGTANFDYATPFNIVLPAAAQTAQEVPATQ